MADGITPYSLIDELPESTEAVIEAYLKEAGMRENRGTDVAPRVKVNFRSFVRGNYIHYSIELLLVNQHNFFFPFQTENTEGALDRYNERLARDLRNSYLTRKVTSVDDVERLIILGALDLQEDGNQSQPETRTDTPATPGEFYGI